MKELDAPVKIFLKDYSVPSHWIRNTYLSFDIYEEYTIVESTLIVEKNSASSQGQLVLDGQELELLSVSIDDKILTEKEYSLSDESLSLDGLTAKHELKISTKIYPHKNTSLEGLYKSRIMFCTQCEAQGFRKITYYLDRPDVMSEFTTRVCADKSLYPVLLSNGNATSEGEADEGRHWVEWHDPHLKPCYLFALVAGKLAHIDDQFTTSSGRDVLLRIFVEDKDLDKCEHAMRSLKNAMRWDEEVYGREYDLDIFMIVAVDDFNMGAMENKGLNIFNTSCVLAHPLTSTDVEFQRVEAVVAHEYFHNWSGNRVTCRDWFQLSLKEGFTVFRDAEFSADMGSRTVKRVEDVSFLRSLQFSEDAGPMAHAVQPASFIEISNFYTLTIYEKGSEIVRMIHSLLGPELFRKGSDLYFERHDGQAVSIDDFVSAMSDVSGRDFTQFMLWYRQAGTPEITVSGSYDKAAETYTLKVKQYCRPTPECSEKQNFVIPISLSLIGEAGKLPLLLDGVVNPESEDNTSLVVEVTEKEQDFVFASVKEKPVPALLRGFSAPVKLKCAYTDLDLLRIITHEDDGFCRWDAAQQLAINEIQRIQQRLTSEPSPAISEVLVDAYRSLLIDESLDPAMVALMLSLPSEKYLGELSQVVDVDSIHHARKCVERKLAKLLRSEFFAVYERCQSKAAYQASAEQIAHRSLKNMALQYLVLDGSYHALDAVIDQFESATNMTDELAAFRAIVHSTKPGLQEYKEKALTIFYEKWKNESLVVNHWLSVQATQPTPDAIAVVQSLMQHEAFDANNPNKLRSLVGTFCNANIVNFHAANGAGYQLLKNEVIRLNKANPQIASKMLTPLTKWQRYDDTRKSLMKQALLDIQNTENLSKDVFEVVSKTLA